MFTGLVESVGKVTALRERGESWDLQIECAAYAGQLAIGESVAVNGCCLTVVKHVGAAIEFNLLGETLRSTSLGALSTGHIVNLERSVPVGGRMGGHFVSGHVDTTGTVRQFEQQGKDWYLEIAPKRSELLRYVVEKGSITVDGISLTVATIHSDAFGVWIIPHTRAVTNLQNQATGGIVNLEFDILAKYVERLLQSNLK